MVEFIHGVVALLAGLILVLTALVGWLYLQQSRMSHAINALAVAVTAPPPSFMYTSLNENHQDESSPAGALPEAPPEAERAEDDRLSVHDVQQEDVDLDAPAPSEHILESAASADDDVSGKTMSQLREMLTAKGIPFNKSDKKSTLVSLVQVSA
jgi:predicted negative regulator of RcsB-dependent stress response